MPADRRGWWGLSIHRKGQPGTALPRHRVLLRPTALRRATRPGRAEGPPRGSEGEKAAGGLPWTGALPEVAGGWADAPHRAHGRAKGQDLSRGPVRRYQPGRGGRTGQATPPGEGPLGDREPSAL